MGAKTIKIEKGFDAVAFMRKQRDKISKDIANMDFEEIKEYFSKKRKAKHPTVNT
jgi:hypothetical protein